MGELDLSRAQMLLRYTGGANTLAALHRHYEDKKWALTPACVDEFSKFQRVADSFVAWYNGTVNNFEAMGHGWTFDPAVCKIAFRCMRNIPGRVLTSRNSTLADCDKQLQSLIPAKSLLENPRLMTDADRRKALSSMTSKLSKHPCMKQAGEYKAMLRTTLSATNSPLRAQVSSYGSLCDSRQLAKLTSGINWAVDQVVTIKPERPEDIEKHARSIQSSLKSKGLGASKGRIPLPAFFDKVLLKMLSVKERSKAEPTADTKASDKTRSA